MAKPACWLAPNLIGTFLLPFGAYWFFKKYFLMRNSDEVKLTCIAGLILVIINEYLQLIPIFGRTFDYLDIFASFIGISIGYAVFVKLMQVFSERGLEKDFYQPNLYDQQQ